jgi:transcriptional regulator with XRE-family HTH domain
LGSRLARLRDERGWTIGELAKRAGIDPSLQGRLERGEVGLSAERMELYAEIFGIKIGSLFEEMPADASAPTTEAAS